MKTTLRACSTLLCKSHSLYDHYTESTRYQTRFLLPGLSISAFHPSGTISRATICATNSAPPQLDL
jgi:hypothetical protein